MAAAGLQPEPDFEPDAVGQFLTFVVPALNGCNLKCPFCLIRQRREITDTHLSPRDFARFIREAANGAPIIAVAIQGYEPLLPESLPYTQAILATSQILRIPTSVVTNGVNLANAIDLLATMAPSNIAVSLDSASPEIHDHIRGVGGAWSAAVKGIERAIEVLAPKRLAVSSVLMPSKRHYLGDVPKLLRKIGIDRWIISPVLRVDRTGSSVANRKRLFRDLLFLQKTAEREGVRLTIDDEFDHLEYGAACASDPLLRRLYVRTLPPNVEIFRLAPSGQCSFGDRILQQMTTDTPRWQPGIMHAGGFLEMLANRIDQRKTRICAPLPVAPA